MVDPALSLNRAVPDPLVSRDHDEVEAADDLEPGLVARSTRHFRKIGVPAMHDSVANLGEPTGEEQVVLVDEPAPPAHAAYECAVSSNAHAARTSSTGMS